MLQLVWFRLYITEGGGGVRDYYKQKTHSFRHCTQIRKRKKLYEYEVDFESKRPEHFIIFCLINVVCIFPNFTPYVVQNGLKRDKIGVSLSVCTVPVVKCNSSSTSSTL